MINTIKIKAFKSIEDTTIDLGYVNVFVGANGSGKSNILEGIGILSAAANGRVDDMALLSRGVRPGVQQLYKCAFQGVRCNSIEFFAKSNQIENKKESSYRVLLFNPIEEGNYVWQYHTESLKYGNKIIAGRSHHTKDKRDCSLGVAAWKSSDPDSTFSSDYFDILKKLKTYSIYSPETAVLRGISNDPYQKTPLGLNGGNLADALVDFRKTVSTDKVNRQYYDSVMDDVEELIDWASSFNWALSETVPVSTAIPHPKTIVRFTDRFMKPSRNKLSGYDSSEGALYVLFHALLATSPKTPRFYAVDNADHALNPRLCQKLFRYMCRWILESPIEKQILLTTHNPLALNGLPLLDPRVRLFTVSRSIKGRTIVKRVEWTEQLEEKRKQGCLTLSDMWITGELGGMPYVF